MTIEIDTENADEAIKVIRRAKRDAKKNEARLSELRAVALVRARAAAFNIVDTAFYSVPRFSIYRQDGNDYDRSGFNRMVSTDCDNASIRFETADGHGTASLYRPSRVTHIVENGAGFIVAVRYDTNGQVQWFTVGTAGEVTHIQHLNPPMADIVEGLLSKMLAYQAEKRERLQSSAV